MLKDYLVGINFESSELLFGRKKVESWFTRDHMFKLIIILSVFAFIVSVFIIVITAKDR